MASELYTAKLNNNKQTELKKMKTLKRKLNKITFWSPENHYTKREVVVAKAQNQIPQYGTPI